MYRLDCDWDAIVKKRHGQGVAETRKFGADDTGVGVIGWDQWAKR